MTIQGMALADRDIAIFSRNHREYVDEAVAISSADPQTRIVFRAKTTWVSAMLALAAKRPRPLYIAPIGGAGFVEYIAELHDVLLNPQRGKPDTEKLLHMALSSTREEELWEDEHHVPQCKTLYAISHCRRLEHPFPLTYLVKIADGKPISKDYGYSYSVVYQYTFNKER